MPYLVVVTQAVDSRILAAIDRSLNTHNWKCKAEFIIQIGIKFLPTTTTNKRETT